MATTTTSTSDNAGAPRNNESRSATVYSVRFHLLPVVFVFSYRLRIYIGGLSGGRIIVVVGPGVSVKTPMRLFVAPFPSLHALALVSAGETVFYFRFDPAIHFKSIHCGIPHQDGWAPM